MATVLTKERRPGGVTLSVKGGMLVVNETYEYRVDTDSATTKRNEILATVGLPIPNLTVSPAGIGICKTMDARREPGRPTMWWVSATFSSEVQDNTNGQSDNLDPTTWTPVINNVFLDPQEEVVLSDRDGKPYTNGAGILIQDPPTQRSDLVRRDFFQFEPIRQLPDGLPDVPSNYVDIPLQDVISRNNTTNRETYLGVKPDKLLLTITNLREAFFYGSKLRLVQYSLTYNKNGWLDRIANTGDRFRYNGKFYPYRYKSDPTTVIEGPLGIRDVKVGEDFNDRDALPHGTGEEGDVDYAVEIVNGEVFALPPTKRIFVQIDPSGAFEPDVVPDPHVMHYIERRRFDTLNFADFLRLEST